MADNKDPFAEFGGSLVAKDKDPFAEFGGSKLRGKPLDTDLPTGTQTSKRGFEPFLPQVPTKAPSVLTAKGQVGYQEQVKDFKPIVQKPIFESPKAKQQRESGYENIAPLLSGLQSTVSSFYKIPRYIYDVFAIPQNLVADLANVPELKANYDNVSKGALNPLSYLEYAGDYTKGKAKEWESKQRKYDEDITTQLFKSGDYGGAGLQIYDNVIASAPSIAAMFLSGGVANAAKLGSASSKIATALPFASAQNQELLENQEIPDWLKPVNAAFNGLSEILLEGKFGTTAILSGATKIAAEKGADAAIKSTKDFVYNYIKKALSKVQPVTDVVSNAAEEMATTLSQNIIARATGEDPNRGIMDGVFDAGIVGGAQGAGASAIRKGLDVLANKKSKGKVDDLTKKRDDIVNDLDNDAIPDAVKEQLEISLEGINQEINNTLDENRNEINNLPEETKLEVAELADKIETINESLQNETISETSKAILEQDLKDAQAELDAKFKLAKPTFDTEEQLVEEIRAAEKEFNETGDSAEYQLKINDLNTRLENLVPAPEVEVAQPTQEAPTVDALKDVKSEAKPLEVSQQEKQAVQPKGKTVFTPNIQINAPLYDKPQHVEGASIWEGEANNDGTYNIYPNRNTENQALLLNDRKDNIVPLFVEGNAYNQNANKLIVAKPAKIKVENGKVTQIVEKGEIYYNEIPKKVETPKPKEDAIQVEKTSESLSKQEDILKDVLELSDDDATVLSYVYNSNLTPEEKKILYRQWKRGVMSVGDIKRMTVIDLEKLKNEDIDKWAKIILERNKGKKIEAEDIDFEEIPKPKKDAVSQPISSQVPVLTEATVGEEVEQGKPQPKTEVVAEEGKEKVGSDVKGDVEFGTAFNIQDATAENTVGREKDLWGKAQVWRERIENAGDILRELSSRGDNPDVRYLMEKVTKLRDWIAKSKDGYTPIDKNIKTIEEFEKTNLRFSDAVDSREYIEKFHSNILDRIRSEYEAIPSYTKEQRLAVELVLDLINNNIKGLESKLNEIENISNQIKENGTLPIIADIKLGKAVEQTPAQEVKQLRAEEQAELKAAIPNADQYLTDGKVDRDKIKNAKDLKKFDKIYDKYDKLITPLLPKKETKAEPTPAKPKAKPRLKPRVETRIKFTKAIELFNDISATKGGAKKRTLSSKRRTFLEQNPSIKYIDDNWKSISKQLEDKGLLKKEGNCP